MGAKRKNTKVAVVYHCVAHYREPIFRLLCEQQDGVEYTIVSGSSDFTPSLNTVDVSKAAVPVSVGGLRWRLVTNHWFGTKLLWQSDVCKLALSGEFDAIIYLGVVYHISTWVSCIIARLRGAKTLMWSHGFLRQETGLKGLVRSAFYRLPNRMLLYHHRAREIMIDRGFDPRKLHVIYNSLDVDMQKEIRTNITEKSMREIKENLFGCCSRPVLLWIGRLTAHKKLGMILSAVEILNKQGMEVCFLLIGDGPERSNLEIQVKEKGLIDQTVFYGACHDESEIGPLISLSDVCIAPGEVGLTAMHSLVYGTPVITHDNPDYQMPEYEAIVPNETGSFFRFGDVDDLAASVRKWLESGLPRQAIRRKCYKVIDERYNPDVQLEIISNSITEKNDF